jgi:hypothetical protein
MLLLPYLEIESLKLSQLWEMQFAVRCNDNIDWDFSDNFVMPSIRRVRLYA